MADAQAAAVRVLRFALLAAVVTALAGVVLDPALRAARLASAATVGGLLRSVAIGTVITTPFLVLVLLVAIERGRRLGWFAAATLLAALAGVLLAR